MLVITEFDDYVTRVDHDAMSMLSCEPFIDEEAEGRSFNFASYVERALLSCSVLGEPVWP